MSLPIFALRTCLRCQSVYPRVASASTSTVTRSMTSSNRYLNTDVDTSSQSDKKINTWFLNQPSGPLPLASSSKRVESSPQMSPSSEDTQSIPSIPTSTPPILLPLHTFLTSSTSEASDVLHRHTVQVYDTTSLSQYLDERGQGDLVKGEEGSGGWYDWVITVQVKGRGRGVVSRGDGVLRRWLLKNPLHPSIPASPHEYPKTPRIPPDSDWSIVPLNLGPDAEFRACVNLLSEEGASRWKLDELWKKAQ
ncbi:uncharacterized protein L199_003300 [Kwoniella botswanensis]|uniref:uncharacterized protein n=1 Tax=Kwoniella botswanensis TaxID=1268659 RepID=UPI00315D2933